MAQARARPWWKFAVWAGAAVLAIVAILAVVVVARVEPEDIARLAAERVKERTGRTLAIDGPVSYSLSLVPTLSAEGVRLQNAPWGTRPDMLVAKRVEVSIALLPLLGGRVELSGLTLVEPDVLLEVDRNGRGNWELQDATPDAAEGRSAGGEPLPLRIERGRIQRGVAAYRNAATGRTLKLELEALELDADASSTEIAAKGSLDGVPVEVQAELPAFARLGSKAKSDVSVTSPGVRLHAKGVLPLQPDSPQADLAFTLEVNDWAAAGKLLQQRFGRRPPLKATGTLRWQPDSLAVDDLQLATGKSRASGHVRMTGAAGKRSFDIRLDAPAVDMTELAGPDEPGSSKSEDGRIFSAQPLPLAPLRDLTGRAQAHIQRLTLRDGKAVDNVRFGAAFDHGRITVDAASLEVDGKPLTLKLSGDASSGKVLDLDLNLAGRSIALGALGALLDITGTPEGSPTDIDVRVKARGNSLRSLMATASGDVRIVVGPGRIRNRVVDLGADITELMKLLNPAYAADPYTELKCAVVRLPLRQGVARIDNGIAVETSKVNVIGAGTIDLRNETLDLGFRTKAATGLGVGLGTLAELGRLRGTLADPKVEVDMGATASTAAHLGLAAITGGLSLVASGLLTDRVPDNPCQVALSGRASAPKAPAQEPGVVDSVLGGIKKLFGR